MVWFCPKGERTVVQAKTGLCRREARHSTAKTSTESQATLLDDQFADEENRDSYVAAYNVSDPPCTKKTCSATTQKLAILNCTRATHVICISATNRTIKYSARDFALVSLFIHLTSERPSD